ncbi:HNH endonuclease [Bacillus sp. BRMEA1]|uniref:HNH endonuclease n=1 Tax=Neobacillus endophyticus TaxID=2738405 RepID=UPI00156636AC|nr:HNH endonuclease [Neobacillus endophyticus]NRD80306.1 HNH endonuclease [Neobacillus endophyticus]
MSIDLSNEFHPVPKTKHSRKAKKRGDRSKFSKMVRDKVKEYYNYTCQMCGGKGIHCHHVEPRGSGKGRGVFTNAMLVCNSCHKKIHADNSLLRHWKEVYRKKFGPLYFMDKEDLEFKYRADEIRQTDKEVQEWLRFNEA